MELPPSGTGWRQTNKIREKIQLLFRYFSFFWSCLHAKNLLWLNCHSRFFYKLRPRCTSSVVFFVRTNSGIGIQGRGDQDLYEHTITRPRCSFHLHVCTRVQTCANVLHTCFFSFIRLFILKTALVQCVHFFSDISYIYTHI